MSNAHDATSNARYAQDILEILACFNDRAGAIQSRDCVIFNSNEYSYIKGVGLGG